MIRRHVEPALRTALSDMPVVLVNGARQVGKTTLARAIAAERGMRYLSLDDAATLSAARSDPVTFVQVEEPLVLDEIQKAPELLPAIKVIVDRDRGQDGSS
ncbi:MAG: AAA family ATPase [Actinomycetota bacterium]